MNVVLSGMASPYESALAVWNVHELIEFLMNLDRAVAEAEVRSAGMVAAGSRGIIVGGVRSATKANVVADGEIDGIERGEERVIPAPEFQELSETA